MNAPIFDNFDIGRIIASLNAVDMVGNLSGPQSAAHFFFSNNSMLISIPADVR